MRTYRYTLTALLLSAVLPFGCTGLRSNGYRLDSPLEEIHAIRAPMDVVWRVLRDEALSEPDSRLLAQDPEAAYLSWTSVPRLPGEENLTGNKLRRHGGELRAITTVWLLPGEQEILLRIRRSYHPLSSRGSASPSSGAYETDLVRKLRLVAHRQLRKGDA